MNVKLVTVTGFQWNVNSIYRAIYWVYIPTFLISKRIWTIIRKLIGVKRPTIHPSPKVMADFSRHKNQHDTLIQFVQFWWMYEMYVNGHFLCKIYWLLALTHYVPGSKGDEHDFFKIKFEHYYEFHGVKLHWFVWIFFNLIVDTFY